MPDPSTSESSEPARTAAAEASTSIEPATAPLETPLETTVEPAPPDVVPGERMEPPAGTAHRVLDPSLPPPSTLFLVFVAAFSFAADILSKNWAEKRLAEVGTIDIIKNYFSITLAKNRGGAWGIFQGQPESLRRPFFLLVSAGAIIFISSLYRRLHPSQTALKWGLPLVLGGALGNVFDRIRYGHVIDFLDVYVVKQGVPHRWPTFNVADVCICVGVLLMAIDMLFTKKRSNYVRPAQGA